MKLKKGKRYVEINNKNVPIEQVDKKILKEMALLPAQVVGYTEVKSA
jgi:hypothetical protein